MSYDHPTGRPPKRINIVALGPTQNQFHAQHFVYDPQAAIVDETWTCNKGFRTVACDLVFILDDLEGERRKSFRYHQEIKECKSPIVTSIIDRDVLDNFSPKQFSEFPIGGVIDFYGAVYLWHQMRFDGCPWEEIIPLPMNGSDQQMELARQKWTPQQIRENGIRHAGYLKNSIPMILAYAGYLGVREINLWGADYDFPGQAIHEADKPNAEYWVGSMILGLGLRFMFPQNTTLLSINQGRDIYGYGTRQPMLRLTR